MNAKYDSSPYISWEIYPENISLNVNLEEKLQYKTWNMHWRLMIKRENVSVKLQISDLSMNTDIIIII